MFEDHGEAIGELLKIQGRISHPQLEAVRQECLTTGSSLADKIIEQGLIGRSDLFAAIAEHLGLEYERELPRMLPDELAKMLPGHLAKEYGVVPLRDGAGMLEVGARDPFSVRTGPDLSFILDREVRVVLSDPVELQHLIQRYYPESAQVTEPASEATALEEYSVADLETMAGQPPVIRFVNRVLAQAIRDKASDIHLEPFAHEFKIRYRVDGMLYETAPPPRSLALPIASRIKVLANLNIAERRLPQDGRIRLTLDGRAVDLRVSTLPTQGGESVVLRVLDQSSARLDLTQLGMPPGVLQGVSEMIRRPHGIFVVTGPTGSGKTTTLYSGLRAINTPELKLLTAEDPVEYGIEGIMQVPVNPAAGLTFASAMRAFLRQDPDVIMVGEIRDLETAQTAIQAALTGHLVLSTLHTNDAPGAVTRLLDMGIEPFLVAATLEGVLAQRLVRRLCPTCREVCATSAQSPRDASRSSPALDQANFYVGRGCAQCGNTGYRGRVGIYEWLPLTDGLRELITDDAPALGIQQRARAEGMRTLREEGLRVAGLGETTLEEILKHT